MIFGWDISTSIIGLATFTDDGKYVNSDHLDLRKMDVDLIDKAASAAQWIKKIARAHSELRHYDCVHYIEDRLGGFSGGKTMQQTLLKLAAFNLTVSYIIWNAFHNEGLNTRIEHIHPSTVKSLMKKEGLVIPKGGDKKELTLAFVSSIEPLFVVDKNKNDNPQPWCYDRADAFITARAGVMRNYLSSHAQGTETSGNKKDTGSRAANEG